MKNANEISKAIKKAHTDLMGKCLEAMNRFEKLYPPGSQVRFEGSTVTVDGPGTYSKGEVKIPVSIPNWNYSTMAPITEISDV